MRRLLVVLALALTACTTTDTALPPAEQEELATATELKALALIAERALPWEVTQSEFQDDSFIIQMKLRESLAANRASDAEAETLLYYEPMQVYRDAVGPVWDRFGDTEVFILAFRDEEQTVIEMSDEDLDGYIHGKLTDEEMFATSTLTTLTQ